MQPRPWRFNHFPSYRRECIKLFMPKPIVVEYVTMCLVNENDLPKSPKNASPRSPWAKFLNRQNAKPRLPRKVVTSARVNLNKCWSKLGELISNSSARSELPNSTTAYAEEEPILVPFTDFFYPSDPVKPENDKAENEGTGNGRFELLTDDVELLDNAANEVREICYSATKSNCYLCNLSY